MTRASTGLALDGIDFAYGGARALNGVSLAVPTGGVVALLGSNGAGKTTTAKVIAGALRPAKGTIVFDGQPIAGLPSHQVMRRGVVLVPEGRLVFAQMTIQDNLMMGAYKERSRARVMELLEQNYARFPRLKERRHQLAGSLSGGEQQMLAIGRGLMAEPRLLVLDEPSLGIMPKLVQEIFALIRRIAEQGVSILLIEQNARASLELAGHAYVLEKGQIILQGEGSKLLADAFVQNAYLGTDA
jgi:branched-chain amino acid transport system ATP-binding protein